MARKSTEIRIAAWMPRRTEINRELLRRVDNVGVDKHVLGGRHVLMQDCFRIGNVLVRLLANPLQRTGPDQHPVVRYGVWVVECQAEFLTSFGFQYSRRES